MRTGMSQFRASVVSHGLGSAAGRMSDFFDDILTQKARRFYQKDGDEHDEGDDDDDDVDLADDGAGDVEELGTFFDAGDELRKRLGRRAEETLPAELEEHRDADGGDKRINAGLIAQGPIGEAFDQQTQK